jgi:hypothetical protein
MKKLLLTAASLSVLLLTGCASSLMSPDENAAGSIPKDKAVITFFRTSVVGGNTQAMISEAAADGGKFVGVASTGTKIRAEVPPGEHKFVVSGANAHLLKAKVEANKAYYVRIEPRLGFWIAPFNHVVIKPDQLADQSIIEEIQKAKPVKVNKDGEQWFNEHRQDMQEKMADGLKDYEEESAEDRSTHTLNPEDGIDKLY